MLTTLSRRVWFAILWVGLWGWSCTAVPAATQLVEDSASDRSWDGLVAFFDFAESAGTIAKDTSGVGQPLDLEIATASSVRWGNSELTILKPTLIKSVGNTTKLVNKISRVGEFSVEAWIQPASLKQTGPARIVTASRNPNQRNFTLGQDRDRFEFRLRTTQTSVNGIPATVTDKSSVKRKITHVVFTRGRAGRTRIFVDGKSVAQSSAPGEMNNWDGNFKLGLGDEIGGGRAWLGTYFMVAIYNRELRIDEVERGFRAGHKATFDSSSATKSASARLFDRDVAGILANHCLECHDLATRQGGLDLSTRKNALAGGDSGAAFVPGDPSESLGWHLIAENEMPAKRPPLSESEKEVLKKWIQSGAQWSVDPIDPVVYVSNPSSRRNWTRRLTIREYVATVQDVTGVDIRKEAYRLIPPDMRADGFDNTAYNLDVDLKHVEAYARLAETIVSRMDPLKFANSLGWGETDSEGKRRRQKNDRGGSVGLDEASTRQLIAKMGKFVLRGPLDEAEIQQFLKIVIAVENTGGSEAEVAGLVLEAMLQSPRFIYRIEKQLGDGGPWPVSEFELASRLSYLVWGAPPDLKLLGAAERGDLFDRVKLNAQFDRMMKDPRAVAQSKVFLSQWLNLERLDHLRPDPDHFPDWDAKLAQAMKQETLLYFEELVWNRKRPLLQLFNAPFTLVTPELADHYDLEWPAGQGTGTALIDLSSNPARGGLLTQGSMLTIGGDEASMVTRGLFVLNDVLRGVVRDPPPCVDTTPIKTRPGLTNRSIAEQRIADQNCGGCHSKFEPLAFGLEPFDGLGVFRVTDQHGNPLREDGKILIPGTENPVGYQTSRELMDLLAGSERVYQTLVWKLTQFSVGRPLTSADAPIVNRIVKRSAEAGGTYENVLREIVHSDLVQKTLTERE